MSVGGETRREGKAGSTRRNWARVVASWFVVFFIVASWSILFRAVSPLIFGSGHRTELVLTMDQDMRGDLCVMPLGPGLERSLADGRTCQVNYAKM